MRCTRRSLERTLAILVSVVAATSCATTITHSNDGPTGSVDEAGAPDASSDEMPDAIAVGDASSAPRDAGTRRNVVCATPPCAVGLSSVTENFCVTVDQCNNGAFTVTKAFCALLAGGHVACWGDNGAGALGRGDDAGTAPSAQPAFVAGIATGTTLSGTCVVLDGGTTQCWGGDTFLQDDGAAPRHSSVSLPISPARTVDTLPYRSGGDGCALLATGEVTCWGTQNEYLVNFYNQYVSFGSPEPELVALPQGAPVVDVATGAARFALRADGVALSWGWWGALGRASSLPLDPSPMPIALSGVSDIDAVGANVCAVAEGKVYCWGSAPTAEADVPTRATPRVVGGLPDDCVQVSTTVDDPTSTTQRACAVTASGDVYCWGTNTLGQAGDGTKTVALVPVKVAGLPEPAVLVRTVPTATCVLGESGGVYCWGGNSSGELGRGGFFVSDPTPAPVLLPMEQP